jgi:hypothetical protein
MYAHTLNNPKAQRLPDSLFKVWVNLLCLACDRDGEIPEIADIAFALRITDKAARQAIDQLVSCRLIAATENGYLPHDWNEHQFKSDVSTGRVKQHRERKRAASGNDDETFHETPETKPETPPDTETESEVDSVSSGKPSETGAAAPLDAQLYRKGRELLGEKGGGQVTKLRQKFGDDGRVMRVLEMAAEKDRPREYIGRVIAGEPEETAEEILAGIRSAAALRGVLD